MFTQPYILVVGAAHIDVFGDSFEGGVIDKPGDVGFSEGGTGFNVATNLSIHGKRVRLFTYSSRWLAPEGNAPTNSLHLGLKGANTPSMNVSHL